MEHMALSTPSTSQPDLLTLYTYTSTIIAERSHHPLPKADYFTNLSSRKTLHRSRQVVVAQPLAPASTFFSFEQILE
jgi:hypothetical protein